MEGNGGGSNYVIVHNTTPRGGLWTFMLSVLSKQWGWDRIEVTGIRITTPRMGVVMCIRLKLNFDAFGIKIEF